MTVRFFILIYFFLSLTSCSYSDRDFYLTGNERNFLESYKKGDTVYFENSLHDIDTFLVMGLDSIQKREPGYIMALPASNWVFVEIRHLPIDNFVSIATDSNKVDTIYQKIISIYKSPQEKKVTYDIDFKGFFYSNNQEFGDLRHDTVLLNKQKITNYYELKPTYAQRDTNDTDIKSLYWTQSEGLVAYQYNNGSVWTKKSSR